MLKKMSYDGPEEAIRLVAHNSLFHWRWILQHKEMQKCMLWFMTYTESNTNGMSLMILCNGKQNIFDVYILYVYYTQQYVYSTVSKYKFVTETDLKVKKRVKTFIIKGMAGWTLLSSELFFYLVCGI